MHQAHDEEVMNTSSTIFPSYLLECLWRRYELSDLFENLIEDIIFISLYFYFTKLIPVFSFLVPFHRRKLINPFWGGDLAICLRSVGSM